MVRGIVKTLLCVALAAGPLVLFVAYQLHQAQQQVEPAPQTLTLAEFIADGAGDNAHLELTDVHFGKPVVEKSGREWKWVWLPLYTSKPPAENAPAPAVVIRVSQVPNKAALDQFVERTSVSAVVCAEMPQWSPWRATLPGRFLKNHPDLDPEQTTILTEPEVRLATLSWGPEVVFDPLTLNASWGIGGGLAFIGLAGLICLGSGAPRGATPSAPAAPATASNRAAAAAAGAAAQAKPQGQIAQERAISHHEFNHLEWAARMFKLYLYLAGIGTVILTVMASGIYLLKKNPQAGLTVLGVSLVLIGLNWCIFYYNNLYSDWGVAEIEVCPSGLRWRRTDDGPVQSAVWTDITDLNVVAVNMAGYGMLSGWRHELTITFRSGERLKVAPFSLKDYIKFAKLVGEGYKEGALGSTSISGGLPPAGYRPLASAARYENDFVTDL